MNLTLTMAEDAPNASMSEAAPSIPMEDTPKEHPRLLITKMVSGSSEKRVIDVFELSFHLLTLLLGACT